MTLAKHLLYCSCVILTACATTQTSSNLDASSSVNGNASPDSSPKHSIFSTPTEKAKATEKNNTKVANPGKAPASWEISGALAAKNKNKAWTAQVNWQQRGSDTYQIRLFGPLGSGTVMIEKKGGVIHFQDGKKSSTSSNAEQLLAEQTGVRLPVSNLYYWVRGLPAPGGVQAEKRATGKLLQLRQSGFTIDYPEYTKVGNTQLPSIIRLQGNGVYMKLVIKRWKI